MLIILIMLMLIMLIIMLLIIIMLLMLIMLIIIIIIIIIIIHGCILCHVFTPKVSFPVLTALEVVVPCENKSLKIWGKFDRDSNYSAGAYLEYNISLRVLRSSSSSSDLGEHSRS